MTVPSSISSSEVGGPWGRTWILAIALAAVALGAIELHWRARGFKPAVSDSARLWSTHRHRAHGLERPGSVIVGASRVQYAIDLDAFADETGWPVPIQLAIQGRSPLPILNDLAEDSSFKGLVIVEVTDRILFQASRQRERRARLRVAESRELAVNQTEGLEAWFEALVGSTFAFRNPELSPDRLLALSQAGLRATPRERWVESDRSAKMDFSRVNEAGLEQRWVRRLATEKRPGLRLRNEIIGEVAASAEAIRARGGEVVLVKLPNSGRLGEMENERFPREVFWDVLAERVGGPAVHFEDYEELRSIPTPDGSHVDAADAAEFTRTLARIIKQRAAVSR